MTERLKVAVIEDDKTMREGIANALEEMGCLVVGTAANFEAALALIDQLVAEQVQVVFLDGNLLTSPNDGERIAAQLCQQLSAVKIFGISAFDQRYADVYVGKNAFHGKARERLRRLLFPSEQ